MKSDPQTCAEAGAYFMDGARPVLEGRADYDDVGGWCGLVSELCSHAEYADNLAYAGYAVMGDYPGVWGYEVGIEYGRWFATHLIEHDDVPPDTERRLWLLRETEEFFLRGDEPRDDLSKALQEVQ